MCVHFVSLTGHNLPCTPSYPVSDDLSITHAHATTWWLPFSNKPHSLRIQCNVFKTKQVVFFHFWKEKVATFLICLRWNVNLIVSEIKSSGAYSVLGVQMKNLSKPDAQIKNIINLSPPFAPTNTHKWPLVHWHQILLGSWHVLRCDMLYS